jgi:glycosyltransferase involved in cell wall biosynthesis
MKKILIFSLGPIFKDYVHGGSQKVLREVSLYLGKKGNKIDIYCVERKDNKEIFKLGKNVTVYPKLKFKETFPSSYKTSPYNLWKIIETLNDEIKKHDVLYIHDAGLNFNLLCNSDIPTIISLRDFLYPETLLGAFNFRRDKIIVNSLHTLESLKYTVGNYNPDIEKRVKLIENGINLNLFKKTKPNKIFNLIEGKINKEDKIILYPHRPDPSKGIYQAIELVRRLVFDESIKNIKILIPRYIDEDVNNDLTPYYNKIKEIGKKLNIEKNILFHKWVPYELMPEYYSLGDLTLSIGNFIEAFGSNVGLESLSCGTPVIMSLVGGQRYTLPENLIPKVPYDDLDKTKKIAKNILLKKDKFDAIKIRKFIKTKFSYEKMLKEYEMIFQNTNISKPLPIKFPKIKIKKSNFIISPWCCLTDLGIYNDYEYRYYSLSKELTEILRNNKKISFNDLKDKKIREEVMSLFDKGIFVNKK